MDNVGKSESLKHFLHCCHDALQYFVDLFWQRQDFSADLADLETVHCGRDRFGLTTRLTQALAKQAKELVRSAHAQGQRQPQVRKHTVTLYSHFVKVETFDGSFDWAVNLIGSGAPRMVIPVKSTAPINRFLNDGWVMAKTIRLGRDHQKRLFVDFIFEKPRLPLKTEGTTEGMDSNYKNGVVLSDGQIIGQEVYERIQTFTKRMSHWLYACITDVVARRCEELGIWLERKSPAYTSITCSGCGRCDRRSRVGDRFRCRHCGFSCDADLNAALNLKRLGEAEVYGLRSLPSWSFV